MISNFTIVLSEWRVIAGGLFTTIWICGVSIFISFFLSLIISVLAHSHVTIIRIPIRFCIDILRAIPFLLLLFLGYYCLPYVGIQASAWTIAILSMLIYNAAYFSEILRGALAHLSSEQIESGRAFGYTGIMLYRRIVFPQIVVTSAFSLGNQSISLVKNSAFLMIITIPELTAVSNQIQTMYFVPFESMFVAIMLYWIICLSIEQVVRRLDRISQERGSE